MISSISGLHCVLFVFGTARVWETSKTVFFSFPFQFCLVHKKLFWELLKTAVTFFLFPKPRRGGGFSRLNKKQELSVRVCVTLCPDLIYGPIYFKPSPIDAECTI